MSNQLMYDKYFKHLGDVLYRKTTIHEFRAVISAIRAFKTERISRFSALRRHDDISVAKSHFGMSLETPTKIAKKSLNSN